MCLDNCCGAIPVKAGTLILLWTTMLVWSIYLISGIYDSCSYDNSVDSVPISVLIFCGLNIAIAACGIFAIDQKRASYLIPYFILQIFWLIIFTIFFLLLIVAETYYVVQIANSGIPGFLGHTFKSANELTERQLLVTIIFVVLTWIVQIHFTSVVYKCYREIEEKSDRVNKNIAVNASWSAREKTTGNVRLA